MTQGSRDLTASGGTGTVVQKSGPYRCEGHAEIVVFFKKGDKFSTCPINRGHATTWSIIRNP